MTRTIANSLRVKGLVAELISFPITHEEDHDPCKHPSHRRDRNDCRTSQSFGSTGRLYAEELNSRLHVRHW
jgi:hypothetical protein